MSAWNLQTRFTALNKNSQWQITNRRCLFLWVFTHLLRSPSGLSSRLSELSVLMTISECFSPKFRLHGQHLSPEYLLTISVRKQRRFMGSDDLHSQVCRNKLFGVQTRNFYGNPIPIQLSLKNSQMKYSYFIDGLCKGPLKRLLSTKQSSILSCT